MPCPACTRFSRAYLRHLVNQRELLGLILLSVHNVRFVLDVAAGARTAIERGEFGAYRAAALSRLAAAAADRLGGESVAFIIILVAMLGHHVPAADPAAASEADVPRRTC